MRKGILIGAIAALVVFGAVAMAMRHTVVAALLPRIIGVAIGYDVTIADERFTANHGALLGVRISKNGEPVLEARRIDIGYSLRDLLPGSRHRYGISSIDIDQPYLTIVRHKDGSYNLALPQGNGPSPVAPQPINRVPIALTVRIRDARGELRAPFALDPQARSLAVRDFNGDAVINTSALTHYRLSGAFVEHPDEPFTAQGRIDMARGYAMHHAFAAAVPLRAIANFFINSEAARILGGTASNFNARMYSLDVAPYKPIRYHMSAQLDVTNGALAIAGLAKPLRHIGGTLQLVDDDFFAHRLYGTLASVPVTVTGAIFDFADPQYKFGISARGDLTRLRTVFGFSRAQPVAGNADVGALVEGPLGTPVIVANLHGNNVAYGAVPLQDVRAPIAYYKNDLYIASAQAHAQGASLQVSGTIETLATLHSRLAFHVSAPADRLPYAGEFLGAQPLVADALLDGTNGTFHAHGALWAANDPTRAAAAFDFEPSGVITISPLWLRTAQGSIAGAYHLDRARDASAFWLDAHNVALHTPAHASFLDRALPALPPLDGTVDDMALEGGGPSGVNAVVAGSVRAHGMHIAHVAIDELDARFSGSVADAAVAPAHARGPWGSITGSGALTNGTLLVRGAYAGNLEGLRPFLAGTPAQGRIDGPIALAIAANGITVQADNLALEGANVRGVPLSRITGTLALAGHIMHVYNAHADAAGGDVVASGTYDTAGPSRARVLSLVASGLDGARLHGLGFPLDGGRVAADGTLSSDAPLPRFDGGISVGAGRVQHYRVAGSALITLAGDGASIQNAVASVDGSYAIAHGSLGLLNSGSPQYALHADVPAASVARVLHTLAVPAFASEGTLNGAFDIAGRGLDPTVRGPLNVPAGSVNGLPFIDGTAIIRADRSGMVADAGHVLVGETRLQFAAAKEPSISNLRVRAPRADLSDFNNFFDTGDTLDGNGGVTFDVVSQRHRIASSGDVDVTAFRYRNITIGNTRATWSSRRNVLAGSLAVGGANGTLHSHGSVVLAPRSLWQNVLRDSRYDLALRLDRLDLSTWTAALGFPDVPITGRLDANARIDGTYPNLDMRGTSALHNGTVWRLPLDSFTLAFSARGPRLKIDRATLSAPGIDALGSGSLGYSVRDPLDLNVHATSHDVPKLVAQLVRYQLPVTGDFESTVHVGGEIAKPTFEAAFDMNNVHAYGISIPSAFGSLRLHGRSLELRNAGVALDHGEATIAGTLPMQLAPFAIGPPSAPVSFDLALSAIDPSDFAPLLGNHTELGGRIDGQVGLSGTAAHPQIFGAMTLAGGAYRSDLERTPVTNGAATLTFNRVEAALSKLHANLGSGTLDGSARLVFPNGFGAAGGAGAGITASLDARGAELSLPSYGTGKVDAALKLTRTPGSQALLAGAAHLSDATIPFAAFLAAQQSGAGTAGTPFPLGFDLTLAAAKNVRVRGGGYGAGLDIGAVGSVHLAGNVAAPTLKGLFTSTGGTLTYVDRAFRVQDAAVAFSPENGVIPTLNATGVTHVVNPDPDIARNPYGSADITIKLRGPVTNLQVSFDSNPPGYNKEQILAMIAPFGGFINGIGYTSGLSPGVPGGTQQLGALQPVPGSGQATQTGTISVGQEAFNILNAQFTAGLFAPIENAIQQGLGFSDFSLTVDYYGNVGFSARRILGRTVDFIYSSTFGLPTRQSFGLALRGSDATSAQLSFFFVNGPTRLFQSAGSLTNSTSRLNLGEALQGTSGFSFTLQRLYW